MMTKNIDAREIKKGDEVLYRDGIWATVTGTKVGVVAGLPVQISTDRLTEFNSYKKNGYWGVKGLDIYDIVDVIPTKPHPLASMPKPVQ